MFIPRIIPCLLIDKVGDMIKTIKFDHNSRRYIGDVENAVKIFNEKKADELMILDIDASTHKTEPNYDIIKKLASSCRMPLAYGGGIKNLDQVKKIISLGVEKVILSSVIFENIELIKTISDYYGSQSVATCIDIFSQKNKIKIFSYNGNKFHENENLIKLVQKIQYYGSGELIINSIDRDGTMKGYNLDYLDKLNNVIKIPITLLGGAGSVDHFLQAKNKFKISGLAAGSFFIYKGKHKGVLISYPKKEKLFNL